MSKGTLIYIGGFKLPDKNAAAQRVIGITKILLELDYDVVFIDVTDDKVDKDILTTKKDIMGCDCYSIYHPKKKEWLGYCKYFTSIEGFKKVYEQYSDVKGVIAYNFRAAAFIKLKKFCERRNVKLIADCTEWYAKSKNIVDSLDIDLRMKIVQPSIDGVIAISRYLYNYYNDKVKTTYIPPTVDSTDEKWITDKIDIYHRFVYAGSPGRGKDKLNAIIESFSETVSTKEYILQIVGLTEEQYLNDYPEHKEIINDLRSQIVFKGRVSHIEAVSYIKHSDYSIIFRPDTLMMKAGFPTKFVEAVTAGTPVVTNKSSDLMEYIKDGENAIFIDGYEKDDIKTAFERIFKMSDSELAAMKERCRSERETFDYRNYKERMEEFLNGVLDKR